MCFTIMTARCFHGDRTPSLIRIMILFPTPDLDRAQPIKSPSLPTDGAAEVNSSDARNVAKMVSSDVTTENITQSRMLTMASLFISPRWLACTFLFEGTVLCCKSTENNT